MIHLLGLLLISFAVTSIFMVPFIDLLFYIKRRYAIFQNKKDDQDPTPIHDQLMKSDELIPVGGGILIIVILIILTLLYVFFGPLKEWVSLQILLFTLLSFGILGLVDDIKSLFTIHHGKFLGMGRKTILSIQIVLALIVSTMLYSLIGLNNIYISDLGNFIIGAWYIPLAAFVIVSFSNSMNIADGLDGLSVGLLIICLLALLGIASASLNQDLAVFIGIWIGCLFAFLYFNVFPARVFLGDAGSLAFGATLAVVGLLTGKILALAIIGGVYVVIVASSLFQILSKKLFNRKLLPVSPIHMYFKYIGWQEPKVVMRFWLAGALFAIFGLWLALLTSQ